MYKKKITLWEIKKNNKSSTQREDHKQVLKRVRLTLDESSVVSSISKTDQASKARLEVSATIGNKAAPRMTHSRHTTRISQFLRSPPLVQDFDVLLLALQSLVGNNLAGKQATIRAEEEELSFVLDDALISYKLNAYAKAGRCWEHASRIVRKWLRGGTIPGHTMLYYLLQEQWPGCLPVFRHFIRFISAVIQQELYFSHPLFLVTKLLEESTSSVQRGSAIWDCILDHMTLSVQNSEE